MDSIRIFDALNRTVCGVSHPFLVETVLKVEVSIATKLSIVTHTGKRAFHG